MSRLLSRVLLLVGFAACGDDNSPGQDASTIDASDDDAPIDASGGCACTLGSVMPAGTITSNQMRELSGLAASRSLAGTLWTHNDSGDTPRVFAVGTDGSQKGILSVTSASATDWEDMAIGPCANGQCLYIADIGDNDTQRPNVRIYEVDEPAAITGSQTAAARTFTIAYPDGPHNSEALFIDPRDGATYVITKQASSPSTVFRMPRETATATAVSTGTIAIPMGNLLVTAADFYADDCGTRLLVRTYTHVFELSGAPDSTVADLLAATPVMRPVASEMQGEAIAFLADGRGYVTVSEGTNPVLSRVACQ